MSAAAAIAEAKSRGFRITLHLTGQSLVLKPGKDPPADLVDLIKEAKPDILAHLRAERDRIKACPKDVERQRPPDVEPDRWREALSGLKAFLAAGHGDEAERLGWPKDELYAVPALWSQIHLTGAALLIGDREVVEITAEAIRIKTASGAHLSFLPVASTRLRSCLPRTAQVAGPQPWRRRGAFPSVRPRRQLLPFRPRPRGGEDAGAGRHGDKSGRKSDKMTAHENPFTRKTFLISRASEFVSKDELAKLIGHPPDN
jgi:hypothetical protein